LAQEARLGAVAAGYETDLLSLDGDPRADLDRLGVPRMALVGGRVAVDRR
jgi:imidazolonepropionase-like amidohydrolase